MRLWLREAMAVTLSWSFKSSTDHVGLNATRCHYVHIDLLDFGKIMWIRVSHFNRII